MLAARPGPQPRPSAPVEGDIQRSGKVTDAVRHGRAGVIVTGQPVDDRGISRVRKLLLTAAVSLVAVTAASGSVAAESAGPAFVPFDRFVGGLAAAGPEAYPGRAAPPPGTFGEMRQYLLDRYQGVTSTHGYVLGGQTFDCIPVDQQPGLRGQGPRAAAAPPPAPPPGPANPEEVPSGKASTDDGGPGCEEGTVPVRRLTLDELTRFPTLRQFFEKG